MNMEIAERVLALLERIALNTAAIVERQGELNEKLERLIAATYATRAGERP